MRRRLSARLLMIDKQNRVLLFRFVHKRGPLAGQDFWATPGGELEPGETFEQAGVREMQEETGLQIDTLGTKAGQEEVMLRMPDGEQVLSEEHYFFVAAPEGTLSRAGWTTLETEIMAEHRWWSQDDIAQASVTIWPESLLQILQNGVHAMEEPLRDL